MKSPTRFISISLITFLLLTIIAGLLLPIAPSVDAAKPPTRTPRPTATAGPTSTPTLVPTAGPTPTPTLVPTATPTPTAGQLTCSTSTTLEALVTCIVSHFGPFVIPSGTEQSDFRTVVRAMLNSQCDTITLPATLAGIYTVKTFTDSGNAKAYCLFYETRDSNSDGKVDKGWGTFIVNNAPLRELNIAIAHPVDDIATEDQGIGVFKGTDSRSFLLAGATRNLGTSTCQDSLGYAASDAAHNIAHMFFAATEEIDAWYGTRTWYQLQFHGMAVDSCTTNVYMTHGVTTPPVSGDKILTLKSNVLKYHPTWSVTVPGDSLTCSLNATTNVEGRFLNGVPASSCCTTDATSYTQKFFSIEQDPNFRSAADWLQAVIDTWP